MGILCRESPVDMYQGLHAHAHTDIEIEETMTRQRVVDEWDLREANKMSMFTDSLLPRDPPVRIA
jgi:tRNA A58 N-methylase Trm61